MPYPLDRMIPLSALGTLGLLQITSCEVAEVLARFLHAEIHILQWTMEFYLRQLTYGRDLIFEEAHHIDAPMRFLPWIF